MLADHAGTQIRIRKISELGIIERFGLEFAQALGPRHI
jgi:hypothetical protein